MGETANYDLPYPELGDAPNGPEQVQALAEAVDAALHANLVPIGAVFDFPWDAGQLPAWARVCYGQSVAKATYPLLDVIAAASGYPYGSTSTNLTLPDYRGRVGAGRDNAGGTAAGRLTLAVGGVDGLTIGAVGGAQGITLTTAQLPAHNHAVTGTPSISDPGHKHTISLASRQAQITATGIPELASTTDGASLSGGSTGITVAAGSLATANAGSGSAHANVQPTIVVNKALRVQ